MAEQGSQQDAAEGSVSFLLDGREVTARTGEMIISAAEREGTFIPRFCYHPRMKPVGMCRMCLVEVSGPRGATLQPACFIAAGEGMEVVTTSEKVKKAQDGVLEFLLVNHPLDCPVCDKGGECPLQDQTLAYGPGESRFVEEKRHFEKPVPISDLVLLDRERCIQCARCTRFAAEVAGEAQIDFAGRGERVEVATFPTEPFSSYFSGNTVQICPVGALTATPYRFTARPWDLDQVESTCTTCALGCRVAVQSSANRLTRLLGIDSDPVNHGWLCDKGRFVFGSVNGDGAAAAGAGSEAAADGPAAGAGEGRLSHPMLRKDGQLVTVSWDEALAAAATGIAAARDAGDPGAVAVLGGARLSNEGAYAWAKLAKGVLGTDSVDSQLGDGLPADLVLSLRRATIDDACAAEIVVLLTGDVREELPVLFLRLREAATAGGTRLIELAQRPSSLTRYASVSVAVRPGESPAVARVLTGDVTAEAALASDPAGAAAGEGRLEQARRLLEEGGGNGAGVVVVLGRPSLAEHEGVTAEAAGVLARAWPEAKFLPTLRRGNVHGALDMGLAPGLLPGRVSLDQGRSWFAERWGTVPVRTGLGSAEVLASLAGDGEPGSRVRTLVLLGADPLNDFPDRQLADRAMAGADLVVAVTGHLNESAARADVVLPAAVAHERPGTTTNVEGRVSRLGQKLVPPGSAWEDWVVAVELAAALGADLGVATLADVRHEIERVAPAYRGLLHERIDAAGAGDGLVVPLPAPGGGPVRPMIPIDPVATPGIESVELQGAPPRVGAAGPGTEAGTEPRLLSAGPGPAGEGPHVPPADSYSLRLVATRRLYDSGGDVTNSPPLAALVGKMVAHANPYDLDRLGLVTGDLVRVRSSRGSLVVPADADAAVPRGVVAVDFNVPAAAGPRNAASTLIDAGDPVTDVRMETV